MAFSKYFGRAIIEPWILAGDFNCILNGNERSGGVRLPHVGCKWFQKFLFDNGLKVFEASGAQFTWYREGLSWGLDRAIENTLWDSFTPNCTIRNLHKLKSDHQPIFITV